MSGGGSQTTRTEPWSQAQPYIRESLDMARNVAQNPAQYYPGQGFVGTLPSEVAAFANRFNYNNRVFGDQSAAPQFSSAVNALETGLGGGVQGGMAQALGGMSLDQMARSFQGPGVIGSRGFGTTLDPAAMGPQFGQAGGLDARGALQQALEGRPDYAGVQGAIDAANAPVLRQLNEQIIPGLNQRATFTNNMTGGIKGLNRALPEIASRMNENALAITEGERQRALGAQERAAGAITQGGMQGFGLGLNAAMGQRGLEADLARLGLSADQANAGLQSDYRSQLLGMGNLAGSMGGAADSAMARALGMFPTIAQTGEAPGNLMTQFGQFQRQGLERSLADDMSRWDFYQNQPRDLASWYSGIANGFGGLGGSTTSPRQGGGAAGAMGGALMGAQLGTSVFPGLGTLGGGILGGLAGLF